MRVNPSDETTWKAPRTACVKLRDVIDEGLYAYVNEYLAETERLLNENDQWGFGKHLKGTVWLGGRKPRSDKFLMDVDGMLLTDKLRICER